MSHHRRRILWICGRRKKGRRPQTHRCSNSSKQALTQFVMASNASPRLTLTPIRCQKSTGQQAAAPPGGIIPESPGGFAGIRIDVAIERLDERDALT